MPYHVRISTRGRRRANDELALDLSEQELEERFLAPYREGRPITTGGTTFPLNEIERITINRTEEPSAVLAPRIREEQRAQQARSGVAVLGGPSYEWYVTTKGENLTDELIKGPPGSGTFDATTGTPNQHAAENETNAKNVMVVHGRNARLRESMFAFLRALGLNPLEWSSLVSETSSASPYIGDVLDVGFAKARAVVVLMTPDDEARLVDELVEEHDPPHEREPTPQARPNVLFEAGMAFGRNPDRTVIVEIGTLRPFSDIGGRHTVRLDNSSVRRQELADRLRHAGCDVQTEHQTDWHTTGDFGL